MNKISIIVESILAAAVVALFILFFTVTPGRKKPANQEVEASGELLPIAVINTDSILKNYTLAIEASDKLMSRYEESTVKLDTKAKSLQKEAETFQREVLDFQRKVEANAFLSRERAESEQSRLQKKEQQLMAKQQDLENLRQKLSADFMAEQSALTQQLQDSVQAFLREYNSDGHFHLVLNDAVLMNKVAGYDITDEVIEALEMCVVFALPKRRLEEIALHNQNIQILYRKILEEALIEQQSHADLVRFESAADRYKRICKEMPQVVLRAPLVFVASYLEMTPEKLSRVRSSTSTEPLP